MGFVTSMFMLVVNVVDSNPSNSAFSELFSKSSPATLQLWGRTVAAKHLVFSLCSAVLRAQKKERRSFP